MSTSFWIIYTHLEAENGSRRKTKCVWQARSCIACGCL